MGFSDLEIVEGVRRKRNEVLKFIYCRYEPKIKDYILHNSGTTEDARDILQESIIRFYKEIQKTEFSFSSSFDAYFTSIYKNTWKFYAKKMKRNEYSDLKESATVLIDFEQLDHYRSDLIQNLVWKMFNQLGESCRNLLDLFYFERLSMQEIARKMNFKNENTAKTKKYKCLSALKNLVIEDSIYRQLTNDE